MTQTAKILIIDDEPDICEITKCLLSKRKYSCFTASSQKEALALVEKERPNLVLLDVRLGSESGLEVLLRIKELDKNIKVVMVTGLGDEETVSQAKAQGADDFICKPFTADFLYDLVAAKLTA